MYLVEPFNELLHGGILCIGAFIHCPSDKVQGDYRNGFYLSMKRLGGQVVSAPDRIMRSRVSWV